MADYNGVDVTNRSTGANRHGIPLRGGDRVQCIWPTCPRTTGRYEGTKMCNGHAALIVDLVGKHHEERDRISKERIRQQIEENGWTPAEEIPPKPPAERVYFLRVGSYIKIGWTTQLDRRMRSFPPDSILLAVQPGTRADEQQLHKRFAVHRSHGREWYPLVPQILEHVDRVKAQHGEPDQVDFGARPVSVPQPRDKQYIGGPISRTRVLRG